MNLNVPFTNHGLKDSEIGLLRKGNFQTVADLILTPVQDIAKRCKASPIETKRIVDAVMAGIQPRRLERLDNLTLGHDERFSTGDDILDKALGGGISTGMVWEVVGESSAGKTQFALRLSLFIQAPREYGGLLGSSCYLTTSAKLPTRRLTEMVDSDEILSSFCGLNDVHTISVPTAATLQNVLSTVLPAFIQSQAAKRGAKPVKLLVIDALGELFHSNTKTTSATLIERSKDIAIISAALHQLATEYKLAIVVLNEVIDRFDHPGNGGDPENHAGILYNNQARWFNTAEFFGERAKEASLGLVWANQVNTRIMLTRTGRRKYFTEDDLPKRRRLAENQQGGVPTTRQAPDVQEEQQSVSIRRLTVIFSNVCAPVALDYIVTMRGVTMLETEVGVPPLRKPLRGAQDNDKSSRRDLLPTSVPAIAIMEEAAPAVSVLEPEASGKEKDDDDDKYLWDNTEDFDFDALEQTLSQLGQ